MTCGCNLKERWETSRDDDNLDWNRLKTVLERYHNQPGSLIAVLQETQSIYGYSSAEGTVHHCPRIENKSLPRYTEPPPFILSSASSQWENT